MPKIFSAIIHALHDGAPFQAALAKLQSVIPALEKLGASVNILNKLGAEILVTEEAKFKEILTYIQSAHKDIALIWSDPTKTQVKLRTHLRRPKIPTKDATQDVKQDDSKQEAKQEAKQDPKEEAIEKPQPKAPHGAAPRTPVYFNVGEVARVYSFPTPTLAHLSIAIISLGGTINKSDIITYWTKILGISSANLPKINVISVDGAAYTWGADQGADMENTLDVTISGGLAPGSIVNLYSAPNTDAGFYHAISAALTAKNNVISISWGSAEVNWTSSSLQAFNSLFQLATQTYKVNVFAAAGDDGSSDGVSDGKAHADFPASSPWVTACGGTNLYCPTRVYSDPTTRETDWSYTASDGGGGGAISTVFPVPTYQHGIIPYGLTAALTKRGVPDVSLVADPETGWLILVNGQNEVVGGTSCVSPAYAGLIARSGVKGEWLLPTFYKNPTAFNDILKGSNGKYVAGKGYDLTTGLGSIKGGFTLALKP